MVSVAREKFDLTPTEEMTGGMGSVMGVTLSMDMSKMGEMVSASSNVDHEFLTMMIPHHASAILMADEERRNGGDAGLKTLSASIISAQGQEIGQMQQLLAGGV